MIAARALVPPLTALALVLAACGHAPAGSAARPAGPVVLQLPPAAPSAHGAPVSEAEPDVALPPAVEVPAAAACVLESPWQPRGDATLLRLRRGGRPFAELSGGMDARLHLPPGRPSGAALEIDAGGVTLRGHIAADAIPLRPARAIAFQGYAVPLASTLLDLEEVAAGQITVLWPGAAGVTPLSPPVTARLECDDLTVGELEIDAAAAAGAPDSEREARLRLGRIIPLSTEPGGPPVAQLLPEDDDDAEVTVVATSKSHARVLWWREDALIVGWVPSADLQRKPAPSGLIGEMYGVGGLGLSGVGQEKDIRVCAADVPLVAEVGGERATVGAARAGTRIEVLERGVPFAQVSVDAGGVWISEGARLLARASDLARCERRAR